MPRCIFHIRICVLLVLLCPLVSSAQKLSWRHLDSVSRFSWSAATDPSGTLYVADGTPHLYHSIDDGVHWRSEIVGSSAPHVYSITTTPTGTLFAITSDGVYRRETGVASWLPTMRNPELGIVYSILSKGRDTLVATHAYGVAISLDGGFTWNRTGPPGSGGRGQVCITTSGRMCLATADSLFRSNDGGATWRGIHTPAAGYIRKIWSIGEDTMYLFTTEGYLCQSSDGSESWSMAASLGGWTTSVVSHPGTPLFALSDRDSTLMQSTDGGRTWILVLRQDQVGFSSVNFLDVDPAGRVLYGDRYDGLFRFDPANATRTHVRGRSLYPRVFRGVWPELAVNARGTMVTWGPLDASGRSVDDGYTWRYSESEVISNFSVIDISAGHNASFYVLTTDSLFTSTDDGLTYTARPVPVSHPSSCIQTRVGSLLISGLHGVYHSSDDGVNWTKSNAPSGVGDVRSLQEDESGNLFALSRQKFVIVSTDDGSHWRELPSVGLPDHCSQLAVAQGTIYVLDVSNGVYRSKDGGATFLQIPAGSRNAHFSCLAVDAAGRVYLGAEDFHRDGILYSTNNGDSWQDGNTGIVSPEQGFDYEPVVRDFELGRDGRMYALVDSGIYRMEETVLHALDDVHKPDMAATARPNPFQTTTTVTWTLERKQHVDVQVFDLLGRRVASLASGMFAAGTHSMPFTGSGLPQGSYFVRIGTGTGVTVLRLLRVP